MRNKIIAGLGLVAALGGCPSSYAWVDDPFVLRARWLVVAPDDSSSEITEIGGTASVDTNIAPEIDFTFFFTENVAAELITAVTPHRARGNGTAAGNINLGQVILLPPTLTLQWHFLPRCVIDPYLGAGVNYTYFFGVDPGTVARHIEYESSWGGALQAGFNWNFTGNWHVNVDVKKIWIDTTATVQLATPPIIMADIDIDPWVYGVGIGYRFG
ncbi:MAG: OmpW family protein [Proteobacteria bacterium]|nr:OmpW family protein [Pseudomonadota bacterium]